MSFKRNFMDQDDNNDDSQVFQKRSRFGDEGGFRGRGRGGGGRGGDRDRGRGGFRGRGGGGGGRGGFRGRGSFNRSDDDQDNGGRMSFRGGGRSFRGGGRSFGGDRGDRGDRGFGGDRGYGDRGRGFRGGDRGRGGRGRGFGGRGFGDRGFGDRRGGGNFRGRGGGGDRSGFSQRECNIKVGQDAPTFDNITDDKSNPVSLDQFKGQYVVLFIYFKDGTYGCSIEQKNFNDIKEKFDKYNAVILGVSRDDESTHKATIEQQKLTYSLLSDSESKICQAYGAIDERDRITRSTFLISPQGKVVGVWPKVFSFETHAEEVLTKLEEVINGKSNTKDGEDNEKNDEDEENADDNGEEDDDQEKDEEDDDDEQQEDDDDDEDA